MHSFRDLITAKKQSQFSVENCTTGGRYKGVRSQKLHKRTKIQDPPNQRTIITGKGPAEGIRKHQSANLKY